MTCHPIVGKGVTGFVCTRKRAPKCSVPACRRPATRLCDYPTKGGKTCDAPICDAHAAPFPQLIGDPQDFCPPHDRMACGRPLKCRCGFRCWSEASMSAHECAIPE